MIAAAAGVPLVAAAAGVPLVAAAAAIAVGLVLLAAATGHLRDRRGTRAALAAHDVLPAGLRGFVAALLPPLELVLGSALLLGVLGPDVLGPAATAVLASAAGATVLLLAGFTAYLALVLRRTRGAADVPCGCGLGTTPVSHWAVARAGVLLALALAATVASLLGGAPDWSALPTDEAPVLAQALVVLAAGLTLALVTAALPAARAVPTTLTTLRPVGGAR